MQCLAHPQNASPANCAISIWLRLRSYCLCSSAAALSSAQTTFTNLFNFDYTDGAYPYYVYLVQGTDGQLYGTAFSGGNQYGVGTIYKITPSGTFTQIWTFCGLTNCADGDVPVGGLVLAPNGNFYGTASNTNVSGVGSVSGGTIFEITPTGTLTLLHTFTGPDGSQPYANLTLGTDGNLYGTTLYGGNSVQSVLVVAPSSRSPRRANSLRSTASPTVRTPLLPLAVCFRAATGTSMAQPSAPEQCSKSRPPESSPRFTLLPAAVTAETPMAA